MANKPVVYSDNERAIVNALRGSEGMTIAELKESTGLDLKPGHIVAAMKKGLIAATGEREIVKPTTRSVSSYIYVDSDVHTKEDGKPYNYTDNEKNVLSIASTIDSPFTLKDLAIAMNVEKLTSGSINGLVKKGNITKGEPVDVAGESRTTVKVYSFLKDIPNE